MFKRELFLAHPDPITQGDTWDVWLGKWVITVPEAENRGTQSFVLDLLTLKYRWHIRVGEQQLDKWTKGNSGLGSGLKP